MTQRISLNIWFCVSLWLALALTGATFAQDNKTTVAPAPTVAAAASTEQARFLADNEVAHLRLEVFTLGETRLYDSDFKAGNLLDWRWQDQQGQRLADGTYRCVVTVKNLTGRSSQRQGILLIQNSEASWQAPEPAAAALRTTAAEGMAYFATVTNPAELAAAVLAHDGNEARLMTGSGALSFRNGNFLQGKDQEQMRLTAEGKLEVSGSIRTGEGVVFPDGTVQKTAYVASGQTLKQIAEDGKSVKLSPNAPAVGGSGTPNVLMKWAANGVDATNSSVTDNGPGGGITVNGGVQSTFYEASASGTFLSFKPAILGSAFLLRSNSLSGNIWIGHLGNVGLNASDPGSRFATGGNATVGASYYNTAAPTNGLLVQGNVGIGTATPSPTGPLTLNLSTTDFTNANGANSQILLTNPNAAGQNVFTSIINGVVRGKWRSDYGGNVSYVATSTGSHDFYTGGDFSGSNPAKVVITSDGNLGVGATTPASRLHVLSDGSYDAPQVTIQQGVSTDYARLRFRTSASPMAWWDIASRGYELNFWVDDLSGFGGVNVMKLQSNGSNLISMSNGATLTAGGAWTNASDRNLKYDFTTISPRDILRRVANLPIQTWRYKAESQALHIGPMAQDFASAFGVGQDDKHIASVDADGVALGAIQGLYQLIQTQNQQLTQLRQKLAQLEKRLPRRGTNQRR